MILIRISNTGPAAKCWYCPDDSGSVPAGNKFGKFLKDELIPEINKNYRVNGYRIFYGQSTNGINRKLCFDVSRQLLLLKSMFLSNPG